MLENELTLKWSAPIIDGSGMAAGSAFDFIGSGKAQAVYADETTFHIYDADGNSLLSVPRSSGTQTEFSVVADVDNDGSAEVVVGSNTYLMMGLARRRASR